MTVLKGFEDLKPREIVSFNNDGTITVVVGDKVNRYQMCIDAHGALAAHEIPERKPDQVGERKHVPVALRWASTDQGAAALQRGEI